MWVISARFDHLWTSQKELQLAAGLSRRSGFYNWGRLCCVWQRLSSLWAVRFPKRHHRAKPIRAMLRQHWPTIWPIMCWHCHFRSDSQGFSLENSYGNTWLINIWHVVAVLLTLTHQMHPPHLGLGLGMRYEDTLLCTLLDSLPALEALWCITEVVGLPAQLTLH